MNREEFVSWLSENCARISEGLSALADVQSKVSAIEPGAIPAPGQPVTKEQFRNYALALVVEVAEFVQTFDWKSWVPGNELAFKDNGTDLEFADILAFMGILVHYMRVMGVEPAALADAYFQKSLINRTRLEARYGSKENAEA